MLYKGVQTQKEKVMFKFFGFTSGTEGPLAKMFRLEYQKDYQYMVKNRIEVNEKMAKAFLHTQGRL